MPKQITVQCSAEIAGMLVDALEWFIARNYPHGADECSIAAREALLDLAERFRRELAETGRSAYSSRIRAFLCEAVSSYTRQLEQDSAACYQHRRPQLIEVCRGLSSGEGYAAAKQLDEQSPPFGTG
jgi:hypothetical protein